MGGDANNRPSVYLGYCTDAEYEQIAGHLRELEIGKRFSRTPAAATVAWVESIDDVLHERVSRAGLCEARSSRCGTLAKYVSEYIAGREGVGERAVANFRQTEKRLAEFFGDRSMDSITVTDAKAFRSFLVEQDYALATIAMHIKKARQFFAHAVEDEKLQRNPFLGVKAGTQVNAARMRYVDASMVEKVLAVVTDVRWRLLIGLARYAGLRVPSEPGLLKWSDVLKDRLRVNSTKTKKQGKPSREPPISPRLLELIEGVRCDQPGDGLIFPDLESADNLRTHFVRLCERAGVEPWPKPFQNLRLSCETDWMDSAGPATACKWSGNTIEVASKHYHLVRDVDYERAAQGGAKSGAEPVQSEENGTEGRKNGTAASAGNSPAYLPVPLGSLAAASANIPLRGVEPLFAG